MTRNEMRLPMKLWLPLALFGVSACGEETTPVQPETVSRVETVAARVEDPAARFCDVSAPEGQGAALALPALEGLETLPTSGWRWINVWATWCAPCIEELPLLEQFRSQLAADGTPVALGFISVDQTAEAVTTYRASHPAPSSARLVDPAGLPALLSGIGIDGGATIPIHVLVDPTNHIRCARSGAIAESDLATVRAIVRGR